MLVVVEDSLHGRLHLRVDAKLVASVEVAVEAREVAAADFERDAVPAAKEIAGRPEIDRVFGRLAGRDRAHLVGAGSVASANDAVREVTGGSVRIDVDELGRE